MIAGFSLTVTMKLLLIRYPSITKVSKKTNENFEVTEIQKQPRVFNKFIEEFSKLGIVQ